MFGVVIVVLNSVEDAVNLLEKRSSIYSDRAQISMLVEPSLMDWGNLVTSLSYGERWRKSRRMMHQWLHKQAAEEFHPSQQHQARLLLQRLLSKSDSLNTSEVLELEIYTTMAGTIMHSVYGLKVEDPNNTFMLKLKGAMDNIAKAALPSNFLVNSFPALIRVPDWLPWTDWKRLGKEWREQKEDAVNSPFNWTKSEMKRSVHEPSLVECMLGKAEHLGIDSSEVDDHVKEVAFALFGGALEIAVFEYTVNTILIFFVAMLLFPEAQRTAQAEIDTIIGSERLPVMEDRSQLPYIERLIKEVIRWRPILPIGIPHVCHQDDVYNGYRIPKDAIIFGNIWAMNHNAQVYKDPETFEPDRFIDPSVPPTPSFGFGRRICPGIHFAGSSLFIFIASILAAFNIEMAKDAEGNGIAPVPVSENTAIYHPVPFKFKLTLRSATYKQLIQSGV
ncbi:hypothetical protein FRC10_002097 [Ceratobasidium sp. 414]|nr:hypothetical protein FRC10_002097 [Ceratobasidium sp. 414]